MNTFITLPLAIKPNEIDLWISIHNLGLPMHKHLTKSQLSRDAKGNYIIA